MLGTATINCGPTLRATVKVLREINSGYFEVEVIEGCGGWDRPGKILGARKSIISNFEPVDATATPAAEIADPAPLTEPVTGEQYMQILLARQAAWIARHGGDRTFPPLLEWFVAAGDENFVILPERTSAPKQVRRPRVYRSASSLIEARDRVQARMDAITGSGPDDPAAVNISPFARSKAAARAGRRRFEKLDRDLERYTALSIQLSRLNGRIKAAEARERETRGSSS